MKKRRQVILGNMIVLILFLYNFSSAVIITADVFTPGKDTNKSFEATGFFYVDKDENGVWWFITPDGDKFYSIAGGWGPSIFFYGNDTEWIESMSEKLKSWGINTFAEGQYYWKRASCHSFEDKTGWHHSRVPDVFDPTWEELVKEKINSSANESRDDPFLIGYQLANERKWGPDTLDDRTILEVYLAASNNTAGKQKLISFLKNRYDNNTKIFNKVWKMNIEFFDDLNDYSKFGYDGWRIRSRIPSEKINLFRDNPLLLKNTSLLNEAKKDVEGFCQLVAEKFFNFTNSVLESIDPNHLNLGARFHLLGVPKEVLVECGKYADVISINYYRYNQNKYDPTWRYYSDLYGTVPLDSWMNKYYQITDKPILVSEFNFWGNDGSWPPTEPTILKQTIVGTQNERADLYDWYLKNCLNSPYVIGYNFFRFFDDFDRNSGLVNIFCEPYATVVDTIIEINFKAYEIHENASFTKIINIRNSIIQKEKTLITNYKIFTEQYARINPRNKKNYFYNKISSDFFINDINPIQNISNGNILYVGGDGPGNYTKIQYAIDNASNSDTIFVYNGTYHEILKINKTINLIGEDNRETQITGDINSSPYDYSTNSDYSILILADMVNITGFNFNNCKKSVYLEGNNYCNFLNNIFNKTMIFLLRSNYSKIINNSFSNNKYAIITDRCYHTIIDNNTFENNSCYGIWISRCYYNIISKNTISRSQIGIRIVKSYENYIFSNNFYENKNKAICLKDSNNNIINKNTFLRDRTQILKDILQNLKSKNYGEVNELSIWIFCKFYTPYIDVYLHAAFFNSTCNNWNGNYWNRPRHLPKPIIGRKGQEELKPTFEFDWQPLKKPYKP